MLRRLYDWTLEKAAHRHAERWLAAISFIESSFFPIPPDVVLVPSITQSGLVVSVADPRPEPARSVDAAS